MSVAVSIRDLAVAGIALRLVAALFFSLMGLCVQIAPVETPVGQIVFWRSAVALILILAWRGQLRRGLKTEGRFGHVERSLYGCAGCGLATLPLGWADVGRTALLHLVASDIRGGLAHIAMTEAVARAPVSTLATFENTPTIWALLCDAVTFALRAEPISLLGALLIVAAAVCVAFADRIGARLKGAPT